MNEGTKFDVVLDEVIEGLNPLLEDIRVAENKRQSAFEANESQRQANENERLDNEAARVSEFEKNEAERQSIFESNEAQRQNAFEKNDLMDICRGYDGTVYGTAGEAVRGQVGEVANAIGSVVTTVVKGGNLFNKDSEDIITGHYINGASSTAIGAAYAISHYIPIKNGRTYTTAWKPSSLGKTANIWLYDSEYNPIKTPVSVSDLGTSSELVFVTFSIDTETAAYCRFNFLTAYRDELMFVEGGTYPKEYWHYGASVYAPKIDHEYNPESEKPQSGKAVAEAVARMTEKSQSHLYGKIISFNGDSICYGAGHLGGYGKIIADRCGMIYENIGRGGSTITAETYSGDNPRGWICRTIENMRIDSDFCILEGGVNDSALNVPLGNITSGYTSELDDTTFAGAFESMLKQAITRFAGKKIGYIFTHKMSVGYRSIDTEPSYYSIAKECCEKWGVPYLDLNTKCAPLHYIPELRTAYTNNGDGWHPNEQGYLKYYCDPIEKWLLTL